MQLIPAIDLIEGKCVRLLQGNFKYQTHYGRDPLEMALRFEDIGISRLHLVDLEGAKSGKILHLKTLEKLANNTKLSIDFGGGIKNDNDIQMVFDSGANIATISSIAVEKPELLKKWIFKYGNSKILLGADVKKEKISINGWHKITDITIFDFIKSIIAFGVNQIFCTDITKDGLLVGTNIILYKSILNRFPNLKLIASGGLSKFEDIENLKDIGCYGVIIGKALYENKILISEIKKFIKNVD